MLIEINLFSDLSNYLPSPAKGKHSAVIDVPEGSSISDVITKLGLPDTQGNLIFVNGVHEKVNSLLKENDVLLITPPLAGG